MSNAELSSSDDGRDGIPVAVNDLEADTESGELSPVAEVVAGDSSNNARDSREYLQKQRDNLEAEIFLREREARSKLNSDWAHDQQRFSIWLFKVFAITLFALFVISLIVLMVSGDEAKRHVAKEIFEMISAAVVAGFLGYMLARPFDHRHHDPR